MSGIETDAPVFEVARFSFDGDRIDVEGRWSGVRGRRFVRPTLTLVSAGERRRLLASLENKPWAPDADAWVASFPWHDRELVAEAAELAVGPSLVVDLPAPEGATRPAARSDEATDQRDSLRDELAQVVAERDRLREELEAARASGDAEKQRADRALSELAAERAALRRELEVVRADRETAARTRGLPAPAPAPLRTQRDAPSIRNSWLMRATASLSTIVVVIVAALLLTN